MRKIILVLSIALLLLACKPNRPPLKTGEVADMSGYKVDSDRFLVMTIEDAAKFVSEGTGYIYFGFESCPWCQQLIPYLDELAQTKDIEIYYVDLKPGGQDVRVPENKPYMKIVEVTAEYLELDDKGNPRLYVPHIFALKEGNIIFSHAGTVDSHPAPERKMTAEEVAELKVILEDFWKSLK